jgi:hypothetical protein
MRTEEILDIVAKTLRSKLDYNDEPSNDLVKLVTDAIIDADIADQREQFERRIRDKQRRLRSVVLNGIQFSVKN